MIVLVAVEYFFPYTCCLEMLKRLRSSVLFLFLITSSVCMYMCKVCLDTSEVFSGNHTKSIKKKNKQQNKNLLCRKRSWKTNTSLNARLQTRKNNSGCKGPLKLSGSTPLLRAGPASDQVAEGHMQSSFENPIDVFKNVTCYFLLRHSNQLDAI